MHALATNYCCPFCRRLLPPSSQVTARRVVCAGCQREVFIPARPVSAGPRSRPSASPLKKLSLVILLAGLAVGGYFFWPVLRQQFEPASSTSVVEEQAEPGKPEMNGVVEEPLPPEPTPEPQKSASPAIAEVRTAPAKPDPIAWLMAHQDRWPAEVRLTKPTAFPIFFQGRIAGSAQPPVGTTVLLMSLLPDHMLVASYQGNSRHIPVASTDLEARAIAEMAKPDPTRPALASATTNVVAKPLTPEEKKWRDQFASNQKIGSSMDAPMRNGSAPTGAGHVSYTLEKAKDPTPEQQKIYDGITRAMDDAIGYYNKHSTLTKKLSIAYSPGTPTADGNINGHIRLGSQRNTRTCMHEIGHTLGVGTHRNWGKLMVKGHWEGQNANKVLQEYTHKPDAQVHGDRQHFWPGGLNFDSELKSEQDLIFHVQIVQAIVQDLEAAR
jgi:hypothetical protein